MTLRHWVECGLVRDSGVGRGSVPGLGCSYTHPQGRPGEICVMGPKGQKVSYGCLWGGEWVLS